MIKTADILTVMRSDPFAITATFTSEQRARAIATGMFDARQAGVALWA